MDNDNRLPGRVAFMVRWLVEQCQRIASMERGRVTFNFAGPSITVELNEVYRIE